jgi:hypothetical protein
LQARALTGQVDANSVRNCPLGARAYIGRACNKNVHDLRAVAITPATVAFRRAVRRRFHRNHLSRRASGILQVANHEELIQ